MLHADWELPTGWSSKHNDAYTRCFGYDLASEVAATASENENLSLGLRYNPHVRIFVMDNVSKHNIQMWDWGILGQIEDINPYTKYVKKYPDKTSEEEPGLSYNSRDY